MNFLYITMDSNQSTIPRTCKVRGTDVIIMNKEQH